MEFSNILYQHRLDLAFLRSATEWYDSILLNYGDNVLVFGCLIILLHDVAPICFQR